MNPPRPDRLRGNAGCQQMSLLALKFRACPHDTASGLLVGRHAFALDCRSVYISHLRFLLLITIGEKFAPEPRRARMPARLYGSACLVFSAPLWARSAHVMVFRPVRIHQLPPARRDGVPRRAR